MPVKKEILIILAGLVSLLRVECQESTTTKEIEIIRARRLIRKKMGGREVQILSGNVQLRHGNTFFYSDEVIIDEVGALAYPHVSVLVSDTVRVEGDTMSYIKDTMMVIMRGRALLETPRMAVSAGCARVLLKENIAFIDCPLEVLLREEKGALKGKSGKYLFGENMNVFIVKNAYYTSGRERWRADSLRYNPEKNTGWLWGNCSYVKEKDTAFFHAGYLDMKNKTYLLWGEASIRREGLRIEGDSIEIQDREEFMVVRRGRIISVDSNRKRIIEASLISMDIKDSQMKTEPPTLIKEYEGDTLRIEIWARECASRKGGKEKKGEILVSN